MEVLSGRTLLRPTDPVRSHAFYRDTLGLAVYREYGNPPLDGGVVYFLGGGYLEVAGRAPGPAGPNVELWLQVRDLRATYDELVRRGVTVVQAPSRMPWGLDEMWITDPDGVRIAVVEVPEDHPLRRRP
jgi:catechol 2,3-dioxygenase-like lactoylglutathione lyase family enzyme